jgi:YegS/Rv2252/BmrU family lipid kinase
MLPYKKALLFFNQFAGQIKEDIQLSMILKYLENSRIDVNLVRVPRAQNEIRELIHQAIEDGVELFIAAGGDGTVSFVSDPLINTGKILCIIPLGTGNLIAKTLNIPLKIDKALDLITSQDHGIICMDALHVIDDRHYISNLSVGVTPKLMASTCQDDKRRIGFIAYLLRLFHQILGLQLHRYYLEYDHHQASYLASEVLITNGRSTGLTHLEWSDDILVDDGTLDILVIRAANFVDFLKLAISVFTKKEKHNPVIQQFTFKEYCKIESKKPVPVQADGDVIKETPIEIRVIPRSINIITSKFQN